MVGMMRGAAAAALGLGLGLGLTLVASCDNGPSAVETRDRTAEAQAPAAAPAESGGAREAATADPVALHRDGKPVWAPSRRGSAEANAARAFERNGEAFGARNQADFIDKAHAFVSRPPSGTETVRRSNGDTLFYHAASNTFAVATRDGAPRTMFKPDDGAAYWAEQKTRAAEGPRRRRAASRDSAGGDAET
ncbi:MAG TPA: hypothetical protein VGB49_03620 [Caulobacteraceae bacterium]